MMTKLVMHLARFLIIRYLNLSPEAVAELDKIDRFDFDIFKLRKLTSGNELSTLLPYILSNKGLFRLCNLEFINLNNFVRALQGVYKKITYHN